MTASSQNTARAIVSPTGDWSARLVGSNISPTSLLATDYLNHYNEVIMIIEMLPDMAEMFEDIQDWQPCSYAEHFHDCGFTYAELAIEAYNDAPTEFRSVFDDTRVKLDQMTLFAIKTLAASIEKGQEDALRDRCSVFARAMQALADTMGATINGSATKADEELIRSILGKGE